MVLSTTFALAQRHERRGRGNYNDNIDNISVSPTLLSGKDISTTLFNNLRPIQLPRARVERDYNDNTDNISASPTLLSGKINEQRLYIARTCWSAQGVV